MEKKLKPFKKFVKKKLIKKWKLVFKKKHGDSVHDKKPNQYFKNEIRQNKESYTYKLLHLPSICSLV